MHPDQLRPKYETEEHREQEALVAKFLSELFSQWTQLARTPEFTVYDYDMLVGAVPARLEIKVRDHQYLPDFMLAQRKVDALLRSASQGYIPILAVCWKDKREVGVWWPLSVVHISARGVGGRKDRGDWRDVEPVCWLPVRHSARWPFC